MDEDRHRNLDIGFKIVAGVGFLLTFGFGIVQWDEQRDKDRAAARDAAQAEQASRERTTATEFFNRALVTYGEAVRISGQLADLDPESEEFKGQRRAFMTLYYGPMTFVESRSVEAAMVRVRFALDDSRSQREEAALALAWTCRESLMRWSELDLKTITADWKRPEAEISK